MIDGTRWDGCWDDAGTMLSLGPSQLYHFDILTSSAPVPNIFLTLGGHDWSDPATWARLFKSLDWRKSKLLAWLPPRTPALRVSRKRSTSPPELDLKRSRLNYDDRFNDREPYDISPSIPMYPVIRAQSQVDEEAVWSSRVGRYRDWKTLRDLGEDRTIDLKKFVICSCPEEELKLHVVQKSDPLARVLLSKKDLNEALKMNDTSFHLSPIEPLEDQQEESLSRIFVMTSETLLNYLCHGLVPYSRIGLLVLDEAHHLSCRDENKHCFNQIVRHIHLRENVSRYSIFIIYIQIFHSSFEWIIICLLK